MASEDQFTIEAIAPIPIKGENESSKTEAEDQNAGSISVEDEADRASNFSELDGDDDHAIEPATSFDSDVGISVTQTYRVFTRIEVISAREIDRLLMGFHVLIGFALVFSAVIIALAQTVYKVVVEVNPPMDNLPFVDFYVFPLAMEIVLPIANICVFIYSLALFVIYTLRILGVRHAGRTDEQYWVAGLLLAVAVYTNPFWTILRFFRDVNGQVLSLQRGYVIMVRIMDSVRDISFSALSLFYVWASAHSFRILEDKITRWFYVPKVLGVLGYVILRQILFLTVDVYFAEMPLVSLLAMLRLYSETGRWDVAGTLSTVAITLYEIGILFIILWEMYKTKRVLDESDYVKYRSKQIGFRYFLYINVIFFSVFWAGYLMVSMSLPWGAVKFQYIAFRLSYFELQYIPLGLCVLLLEYSTIEAYTSLPADAIGFRGWFRPQKAKADPRKLEPLIYRKREPPSTTDILLPEFRSNIFVMQTHVNLFNFAWYVYYYQTPKAKSIDAKKPDYPFTVAGFISADVTDTKVMIAECPDRIIVAFKGTTSAKNLSTDIKLLHCRLEDYLPTSGNVVFTTAGRSDAKDTEDVMDTQVEEKHFKRARIHKGFANAYRSVAPRIVSIVKGLLKRQHRPICITGHSLGGALAILCGLDFSLQRTFKKDEILLSTFGTPRVGNVAFADVYENAVPSSWRIVVAPDMVARLPKVGYRHVGKKVLLTVDGDLFIDPNSLEIKLWNATSASLIYHRKSSYLLAMQLWCNQHHGMRYVPEFWPWPVSIEDQNRFDPSRKTLSSIFSRESAPGRSMLNRAKMRQVADDIDRLGRGLPTNEAAVANWGRLADLLLRQL